MILANLNMITDCSVHAFKGVDCTQAPQSDSWQTPPQIKHVLFLCENSTRHVCYSHATTTYSTDVLKWILLGLFNTLKSIGFTYIHWKCKVCACCLGPLSIRSSGVFFVSSLIYYFFIHGNNYLLPCMNEDVQNTTEQTLFHNPHILLLNSCTQVIWGHSHPVMRGNSSKLDNATLSLFQNVNTSIVISVIYMIVTLINLVGNGLSMWLLIFRTTPKTPSIIFMINLTLTDLALGAALPFQIAYQLQGYHWNMGPGMCRYSLWLQNIVLSLFILFVLFMPFNRNPQCTSTFWQICFVVCLLRFFLA